MAKLEDLQNEIAVLRGLLAQAGIIQNRAQRKQEQTDYVEYGSTRHAAFLGIVEVDDIEQAMRDGYTVYTSVSTKKTWRLEDEIGILKNYPGIDPSKAALLVLRQKVATFEAGKPPIPANAPPMYVNEEA